MRSLSSKKSDVNLILTAVLTLTLAAFLLIMGLIILDELFVDVSQDTATVYNETLSSVDEGGVSVATTGACAFRSLSVTYITFNENATTIPSSNYTVTTGRGIGSVAYSGVGSVEYNNTDWNVTYTYIYGNNEACLATNATIEGQGKFGDYIDLIVLAIIITVIISMLLVVMAGRRVK